MSLLAIPATAYASTTSVPVLIFNDINFKHFQYQPDPLDMPGGSGMMLFDTTTTDGSWYVPYGRAFTVQLPMPNGNYAFYVTIYNSTTGNTLYSQTIYSTYGAMIDIPAQPVDSHILIQFSSLSPIKLGGYGLVLS